MYILHLQSLDLIDNKSDISNRLSIHYAIYIVVGLFLVMVSLPRRDPEWKESSSRILLSLFEVTHDVKGIVPSQINRALTSALEKLGCPLPPPAWEGEGKGKKGRGRPIRPPNVPPPPPPLPLALLLALLPGGGWPTSEPPPKIFTPPRPFPPSVAGGVPPLPSSPSFPSQREEESRRWRFVLKSKQNKESKVEQGRQVTTGREEIERRKKRESRSR